jgi:hypothetical protein
MQNAKCKMQADDPQIAQMTQIKRIRGREAVRGRLVLPAASRCDASGN